MNNQGTFLLLKEEENAFLVYIDNLKFDCRIFERSLIERVIFLRFEKKNPYKKPDVATISFLSRFKSIDINKNWLHSGGVGLKLNLCPFGNLWFS